MTDKGGELEFIIDFGLSEYKGTKGFGIESQYKGNHSKSIRFLGTKSGLSYKYKEDYNGNLKDKWDILVNSNANYKEDSGWKYLFDKNHVTKEGLREKLKTIVHSGKIELSDSNGFATWIVLKNVEWSNSIIKFNMKLFDEKPISVLFRYNDPHNYYGVNFDPSRGIINLFKRVDNNEINLETVIIKLFLDKWYRVKFLLNIDYFKMVIQLDKIWEEKLIFSRNIEGLTRGTLGFATKGNKSFFINGIDIDEITQINAKKSNIDNKRSWNQLLRKVSYKDRKIYCRESFYQDLESISRCLNIHFYCRLRCDEIIPSVENILNYSCLKDCIRAAFNISKTDGRIQEFNLKYIPKINSKIDYKPLDSPNYRRGIIKKIKTVNLKTILGIEYFDENGSKINILQEFPNQNIKRCGSVLKLRSDCNKNKINK